MKTILKIIVAATVAMGVGFAVARTLEQFAAIAIFGGMFITLIMGAYNERERTRYDSIKHRMGIRKAA